MKKDRIIVDLTPYKTINEKIDAIKKAVPYELYPEDWNNQAVLSLRT